MLEKIRYRLVYNRQNKLNRQGTALVQIEAYLNQRKSYFKTNIYLKPECWSREGAQVINHPQSNELNAMLYEYILYLQGIELGYWKRGIPATLSLLKDAVKKKSTVNVSLSTFAKSAIDNSDKKQSTKDNLHSTLAVLHDFRSGLDFKDLTYTFLRDFEQYLREKGNAVNTIAKHMRQLRTLVNEAINQGYMHADAYPFRKYKIKQEKGRHEFLTPDELKKLETVEVEEKAMRHVLDAFLFCCYVGLRYSDFRQLTYKNLVTIDGHEWLVLNSVKTGSKLNIPLYLLFGGKAARILHRYDDVKHLAALACNSETNRTLAKLGIIAKINKKFTFHTARHTCATLLVYQGVPITTVQRLLGHTSVKTTEIYSEVFNETMIRDLEKAEKALNRKRKNVMKNQNVLVVNAVSV